MNKTHTTIKQSMELAKILPHETADMCYVNDRTAIKIDVNSYNVCKQMCKGCVEVFPCWSLAALLELLPAATLDTSDNHGYRIHCCGKFTEWHDTAVDAAVAMIKKLREHIE